MSYWGGVAARAMRETLGEIRWDSPVRLMIGLGSPLAAGSLTWAATHQISWGAVATLSVVMFLAVITFAIKLATVPPRMDAELNAELATLKATQRRIASRKSQRLEFGEFLTDGQALMVRCGNEKEAAPVDDVKRWAESCEAALSALDESYIARFRSSAGIPIGATSIFEPEHRHLWTALYFRTARLAEFIREMV